MVSGNLHRLYRYLDYAPGQNLNYTKWKFRLYKVEI